MKNFFTLISMALVAMSVNAQNEAQTESWYVNNADGTLKAEYVANADANAMSVVKFSTTNVEGTHTSGPVAGYNDGPLEADGKLTAKVNNTWSGIKSQALSKDGSVAPFYYVQGQGNPVNLDKIEFEEIMTDGEGTGNYRAKWDASYYAPDGSAGLPKNGTYITLTPKVEGTLKVGIWVNKGSREAYVAKQSDAKALAFGSDVKISGYVQATNNDVAEDSPLYGYMLNQSDIATKGTKGGDAYVIAAGNRPVWVYLTFAAAANETYYIFNKNTQIGFSGFEFTPGSGSTGIANVNTTISAKNHVRYNLAGQKVDASYKGVVIVNGKKLVQK